MEDQPKRVKVPAGQRQNQMDEILDEFKWFNKEDLIKIIKNNFYKMTKLRKIKKGQI
nr:hypothetical protein [Mycoplasmopsis bovis]